MSDFKCDIHKLMRPSAQDFEPYDPAFCEVSVNLSANENGFGIPRQLKQELTDALAEAVVSRYPRPLSNELRALLAKHYGLDETQIIIGNGGDELIFNLLLAFGGAGHKVVYTPPTFSVYELYGKLLECELCAVTRDKTSFAIPEHKLVAAASDASLVFLTSPNNPTGDVINQDVLIRVLESCPGVVLMDEAYLEFCDMPSSMELINRYPRLVVLRTFSKAYALAGARIGYVISSPEIINALAAVRQPYSVNVLSQAAAMVVFSKCEAFDSAIMAIKSERSRMMEAYAALEAYGVHAWPSEANFILVRIPDAHTIWQRLRDDYSVLVRDFSSHEGLADCLRITIGTPAENDRLLQALRELLSA